jgi:hypothetical protein
MPLDVERGTMIEADVTTEIAIAAMVMPSSSSAPCLQQVRFPKGSIKCTARYPRRAKAQVGGLRTYI